MLRCPVGAADIGFALLLSGGLSNQTDMLTRGGVIDWLPFRSFTDGSIVKANIADLAGIAGVLLIAAAMIQLNIGVYKNGKRTSDKHETGCTAENIRIQL